MDAQLGRKILVDFPETDEFKEFDFNGKKIRVKKYLDTANDQPLLISTCLDSYLGERFGLKTDGYGAEIIFDIVLLDIATNIKIDSKKVSIDNVYKSGLMWKVYSAIENVMDVKDIVKSVLVDARVERFSISNRIEDFKSYLSGLDEESVRHLAEQVDEVIKSVANSPISSLMEESNR